RRHRLEQPDVLERPAHAARGDLVRTQADERVLLEPHLAGVGRVETGEHVEQRRLAGAVRPDDRGDPAVEREVDIAHSGEAAEAFGDRLRAEERHQAVTLFCSSATTSISRWRRRAGRTPCGRKIIITTRIRPKIIRSYFAGSS